MARIRVSGLRDCSRLVQGRSITRTDAVQAWKAGDDLVPMKIHRQSNGAAGPWDPESRPSGVSRSDGMLVYRRLQRVFPNTEPGRSVSWREEESSLGESRGYNNERGYSGVGPERPMAGRPMPRRPWDVPEDNLPEWAVENPLESGGSFDATGAFHGSDDELSPSDGMGRRELSFPVFVTKL